MDNFTASEHPYLNRTARTLTLKAARNRTHRNTLKVIMWTILITLALIAFALDHLTTLTTVTKASTPEPIHQNSYYCNLLAHTTKDQQIIVIGATTTQLKAVCPNLK